MSRGAEWGTQMGVGDFLPGELLATEKTSTREVYAAFSNEAKYTISANENTSVPQNSF